MSGKSVGVGIVVGIAIGIIAMFLLGNGVARSANSSPDLKLAKESVMADLSGDMAANPKAYEGKATDKFKAQLQKLAAARAYEQKNNWPIQSEFIRFVGTPAVVMQLPPDQKANWERVIVAAEYRAASGNKFIGVISVDLAKAGKEWKVDSILTLPVAKEDTSGAIQLLGGR